MPKGEGEESTDESSADPSEAGIIPRELFAAWQEKGLKVGGRGEECHPHFSSSPPPPPLRGTGTHSPLSVIQLAVRHPSLPQVLKMEA